MTDDPASAAPYADATLENLDDQQDPHGQIHGWLTYGHSPFLLLVGGRGAGKTFTAHAIIREHRRGPLRGAGDDTLPELLMEATTIFGLFEGWGVGTEESVATQHAALGARLLVVDGVGRTLGFGRPPETTKPEGEEPKMFELLDIRANRGLRTVVTTALPLTEDGYPDSPPARRPYAPTFVQRFGEPGRRLVERAAVVYLAGGSRRTRPGGGDA